MCRGSKIKSILAEDFLGTQCFPRITCSHIFIRNRHLKSIIRFAAGAFSLWWIRFFLLPSFLELIFFSQSQFKAAVSEENKFWICIFYFLALQSIFCFDSLKLGIVFFKIISYSIEIFRYFSRSFQFYDFELRDGVETNMRDGEDCKESGWNKNRNQFVTKKKKNQITLDSSLK